LTFLKWTEEYSVGVQAFDSDHKVFVEIINDLHEAIVAGIDGAKLNAALDALAAQHVKREEDYFDITGYPNASTHRGVHKVFSEMMANFRKDITPTNKDERAMELLLILKGWLLLHIQGEDKKFGEFLNSKGIY
jgi:methyl-accepting chemotaxis protein/hemerythrin